MDQTIDIEFAICDGTTASFVVDKKKIRIEIVGLLFS